ncbi:hypothetical protein AB205_0190590 [Aquarana catesbeiana]|uniref:Uncharacterized protein n=1 Tax=Aquarana catesbeiana TaxID=8400 RepID=A0A2G9P425_AQUCT|nr:hypothetical protein AB205_0190590 [Aquarana catesbeiana]
MVAAFKQTAAVAEEPPSSSKEDSPMTESDSESKIDDLRYQQIEMDQMCGAYLATCGPHGAEGSKCGENTE